MTELQKQAVEQTHFWIDFANEIYSMNMPYPTISFKLKGKTAGIASFSPMSNDTGVRYNSILLEENGNDFLKRTVPHEVAHLVVYARWMIERNGKPTPHGYEWKRVMRDFGLNSTRCHSYDVSNSMVRTKGRMARVYSYKCGCQTHNLTIIRHRKIQEGDRYTCKRCRQILQAA